MGVHAGGACQDRHRQWCSVCVGGHAGRLELCPPESHRLWSRKWPHSARAFRSGGAWETAHRFAASLSFCSLIQAAAHASEGSAVVPPSPFNFNLSIRFETKENAVAGFGGKLDNHPKTNSPLAFCFEAQAFPRTAKWYHGSSFCFRLPTCGTDKLHFQACAPVALPSCPAARGPRHCSTSSSCNPTPTSWNPFLDHLLMVRPDYTDAGTSLSRAAVGTRPLKQLQMAALRCLGAETFDTMTAFHRQVAGSNLAAPVVSIN